ncbi:MAG: glucosamine-6-phosphate deaminase [Monoglobales bacterium]
MKKIVFDNYTQLSHAAAEFVAAEINSKPKFVLGLPTGETPVGMYKNLSEMYKEGKVDFANVTTFNLDEYLGLKRSHNQSYWYFMNKNLYSNVNLKEENINIPNGTAPDMDLETKSYDKKIEDMGGLDLMVLGIGPNGHIGFNEPGNYLIAPTHIVKLTEATIDANARFFTSRDEVPKKAVTMGVGNIMKAKKILMLISGENKRAVAKALNNGIVTPENPATMLLMHPDVTVLIDKDADQ